MQILLPASNYIILNTTRTLVFLAGLFFTVSNVFAGGYSSSAVSMANVTTQYLAGSDSNQAILRIEVTATTGGGSCGVDALSFTMQNTSDADIADAKLFYTSTTNTFNTNTQVSTTATSPTGTVTFSSVGITGLSNTTVYFWLAVTMVASPTGCNTVDAYIPNNGLTITGTGAGTYTPTTPNPTGAVPIKGTPCFFIGSGTSLNALNSGNSPFGNYFEGRKNQFLITALELSTAGVGSERSISRLAFNVDDIGTCNGLNNFVIYMKNTASTALTTTWETGLTQVYSASSYQPVNSWNEITFDNNFLWDGTSNVLIEVCFNDEGIESYSQNPTTYYNASGATTTHYVGADNDVDLCTNPGTGSTTFDRPNIKLRIEVSVVLIINTTTTDATCGNANGSASATCTGGNPPYTYKWNNGAVSQTISGLSAGIYTVTATDFNSYKTNKTVAINDTGGPTVTVSATNVNCNGGSDGSSTVNPSGGASPYTYNWSNGAVTQTISGLTAGTYIAVVSDSNNCKSIISANITSPSQLITGGPTVVNANCFGGNDAWASIDNAYGGTSPYSYKWSNGDMDSLAENLSAGIYQITLTDANGCMDQISFAVGEQSEIIISTDIINILCSGTNDASINVSVKGGVGNYNYKWNNGATAQYISNLSSGLYIITVTDFFNCQKSDSIYINDSSDVLRLNPIIVNVSCNGGSDGFASVSGIGGVSPYNYYWSSGSTVNMISGLAANTFVITVSDQNSCIIMDTIVVTEPDSGCGRNAIISGTVFYDVNNDCVLDTGEIGLNGWVVLATPGPFYGITNNGFYNLRVDTGSYTVSVISPNDLLVANCITNQNVNISGINETVTGKNFPFKDKYVCPLLSIDISVNSFRRCSQFKYFIEVCNDGVEDVDSNVIKITFDKAFIPVLSNPVSWDPILSGGGVYYFDIGSLKAGKCTNFWVRVQSDCNLQIGETRCATAEILNHDLNCIFPKADTSWDKSSVVVNGFCKNDSLTHFVITNTGNFGDGNMDGVSEYRIFVNNILALTNTFQLTGGDSLVIEFPANGNTIRLEADQRPGHPGNSYPRTTIESCGTDSSGNVQLGFYTSTHEDDASPYIETFCTEIIGSYDPNNKMVFPKGLYNQNYIYTQNNVLEYIIRFQNTGNDTAINVVLRDTLSPFLDVTTLDVGTSSHDYEFELYNNGIIVWSFDSIMLPDSNVNEEASQGFAKFKIAFKDSLPQKTKIENHASIYFDINVPVVTNTIFVTVFDTIVIDTTLLFPYFCDKPVAYFVTTTIDTLSSLFEITFFDSSQFSEKYFWDFGDGNTDTVVNPAHTFDGFGVFNVCLTVYNECGTDSMCKTLTFVNGIAQYPRSLIVNIYPNPNKGEFFINLPNINTNFLDIELLDITGRIIHTKNYKNKNGNFTQKQSMESFTKGIYYLKVITDNSVICRKIVYK